MAVGSCFIRLWTRLRHAEFLLRRLVYYKMQPVSSSSRTSQEAGERTVAHGYVHHCGAFKGILVVDAERTENPTIIRYTCLDAYLKIKPGLFFWKQVYTLYKIVES